MAEDVIDSLGAGTSPVDPTAPRTPLTDDALARIRQATAEKDSEEPPLTFSDVVSELADRARRSYTLQGKIKPGSAVDKVFLRQARTVSAIGDMFLWGNIIDAGERFKLGRRSLKGTASAEDLQRLQELTQHDAADQTIGYQAGSILAQLPGYIASFALPGLIGTKIAATTVSAGAKAAGTAAAKSAGRRLLERAATKMVIKDPIETLGVGKGLLTVAERAAYRTPFIAPTVTVPDVLDRMTPRLSLDVTSENEIKPYLMEEGDNFLEAMVKAVPSTYIEAFSEEVGAVLPIFGKWFGKRVPDTMPLKGAILNRYVQMKNLAKKMPASEAVRDAMTLLKGPGGWHGIVGEMFEERVGDLARGALGIQDSWFPTGEQLVAEAIAFSIPGIAENISRVASNQVLHEEAVKNAGLLRRPFGQGGRANIMSPREADEAFTPIVNQVEEERNKREYWATRMMQRLFGLRKGTVRQMAKRQLGIDLDRAWDRSVAIARDQTPKNQEFSAEDERAAGRAGVRELLRRQYRPYVTKTQEAADILRGAVEPLDVTQAGKRYSTWVAKPKAMTPEALEAAREAGIDSIVTLAELEAGVGIIGTLDPDSQVDVESTMDLFGIDDRGRGEQMARALEAASRIPGDKAERPDVRVADNLILIATEAELNSRRYGTGPKTARVGVNEKGEALFAVRPTAFSSPDGSSVVLTRGVQPVDVAHEMLEARLSRGGRQDRSPVIQEWVNQVETSINDALTAELAKPVADQDADYLERLRHLSRMDAQELFVHGYVMDRMGWDQSGIERDLYRALGAATKLAPILPAVDREMDSLLGAEWLDSLSYNGTRKRPVVLQRGQVHQELYDLMEKADKDVWKKARAVAAKDRGMRRRQVDLGEEAWKLRAQLYEALQGDMRDPAQRQTVRALLLAADINGVTFGLDDLKARLAAGEVVELRGPGWDPKTGTYKDLRAPPEPERRPPVTDIEPTPAVPGQSVRQPQEETASKKPSSPDMGLGTWRDVEKEQTAALHWMERVLADRERALSFGELVEPVRGGKAPEYHEGPSQEPRSAKWKTLADVPKDFREQESEVRRALSRDAARREKNLREAREADIDERERIRRVQTPEAFMETPAAEEARMGLPVPTWIRGMVKAPAFFSPQTVSELAELAGAGTAQGESEFMRRVRPMAHEAGVLQDLEGSRQATVEYLAWLQGVTNLSGSAARMEFAKRVGGRPSDQTLGATAAKDVEDLRASVEVAERAIRDLERNRAATPFVEKGEAGTVPSTVHRKREATALFGDVADMVAEDEDLDKFLEFVDSGGTDEDLGAEVEVHVEERGGAGVEEGLVPEDKEVSPGARRKTKIEAEQSGYGAQGVLESLEAEAERNNVRSRDPYSPAQTVGVRIKKLIVAGGGAMRTLFARVSSDVNREAVEETMPAAFKRPEYAAAAKDWNEWSGTSSPNRLIKLAMDGLTNANKENLLLKGVLRWVSKRQSVPATAEAVSTEATAVVVPPPVVEQPKAAARPQMGPITQEYAPPGHELQQLKRDERYTQGEDEGKLTSDEAARENYLNQLGIRPSKWTGYKYPIPEGEKIDRLVGDVLSRGNDPAAFVWPGKGGQYMGLWVRDSGTGALVYWPIRGGELPGPEGVSPVVGQPEKEKVKPLAEALDIKQPDIKQAALEMMEKLDDDRHRVIRARMMDTALADERDRLKRQIRRAQDKLFPMLRFGRHTPAGEIQHTGGTATFTGVNPMTAEQRKKYSEETVGYDATRQPVLMDIAMAFYEGKPDGVMMVVDLEQDLTLGSPLQRLAMAAVTGRFPRQRTPVKYRPGARGYQPGAVGRQEEHLEPDLSELGHQLEQPIARRDLERTQIAGGEHRVPDAELAGLLPISTQRLAKISQPALEAQIMDFLVKNRVETLMVVGLDEWRAGSVDAPKGLDSLAIALHRVMKSKPKVPSVRKEPIMASPVVEVEGPFSHEAEAAAAAVGNADMLVHVRVAGGGSNAVKRISEGLAKKAGSERGKATYDLVIPENYGVMGVRERVRFAKLAARDIVRRMHGTGDYAQMKVAILGGSMQVLNRGRGEPGAPLIERDDVVMLLNRVFRDVSTLAREAGLVMEFEGVTTTGMPGVGEAAVQTAGVAGVPVTVYPYVSSERWNRAEFVKKMWGLTEKVEAVRAVGLPSLVDVTARRQEPPPPVVAAASASPSPAEMPNPKALKPGIEIMEMPTAGYGERTDAVTSQADVVVRFVVNLETPGEIRTEQAASRAGVQVLNTVWSLGDLAQRGPTGTLDPIYQAAEVRGRSLGRSVRPGTRDVVLNFAGNEQTKWPKEITPEVLDEMATRFLRGFQAALGIRGRHLQGVVSGYQTGADRAGARAAAQMDLPVRITMPKGFRSKAGQHSEDEIRDDVLSPMALRPAEASRPRVIAVERMSAQNLGPGVTAVVEGTAQGHTLRNADADLVDIHGAVILPTRRSEAPGPEGEWRDGPMPDGRGDQFTEFRRQVDAAVARIPAGTSVMVERRLGQGEQSGLMRSAPRFYLYLVGSLADRAGVDPEAVRTVAEWSQLEGWKAEELVDLLAVKGLGLNAVQFRYELVPHDQARGSVMKGRMDFEYGKLGMPGMPRTTIEAVLSGQRTATTRRSTGVDQWGTVQPGDYVEWMSEGRTAMTVAVTPSYSVSHLGRELALNESLWRQGVPVTKKSFVKQGKEFVPSGERQMEEAVQRAKAASKTGGAVSRPVEKRADLDTLLENLEKGSEEDGTRFGFEDLRPEGGMPNWWLNAGSMGLGKLIWDTANKKHAAMAAANGAASVIRDLTIGKRKVLTKEERALGRKALEAVTTVGLEDRPIDAEDYNTARRWDQLVAAKGPGSGLGTIAQMTERARQYFDRFQKEAASHLAELTDTEAIRYLENYVLHAWTGPKNKMAAIREDIRTGKVRRIPTYQEGIKRYGLTPITLDISELIPMWARATYGPMMAKAAVIGASLLRDQDGRPVVVPIVDPNYSGTGMVPRDVLVRAAENLAESINEHRRLAYARAYAEAVAEDRVEDLKEPVLVAVNPKQHPAAEVERLFALLPSRGHYSREPQATPWRSMHAVYVLEDADDVGPKYNWNLMLHLTQTPWDNKVARWVKHVNDWSKNMTLSFSGFHPFALMESLVSAYGLGMDNPLFRPFSMYKTLTELARDIRAHPEKYQALLEDGLVFSVGAPDFDVSTVSRDLKKMAVWARNGGMPWLAKGIDGFASFKSAWDKWLWYDLLPSMKVWLFQTMVDQYRNGTLRIGNTALTEADFRRDLARHLNSAFGGQNWSMFDWATPRMMQLNHGVFFSADWTWSSADVAGATALIPNFRRGYGELSQTEEALRLYKYWPAMVALCLVGIPNLIQMVIWSAFGDDDEGDVPFTFMNEVDRTTWIDMTPLLRKLENVPGIGYDGGASGRRRSYIRWGKQAWEVFHGWYRNPGLTFLGKMSAVPRAAFELSTGRNVYGWDMPFENTGMLGWIWSKGSFFNSRIFHAARQFLPYTFMDAVEGKPVGYFANAALGTSIGKGIEQMTVALDAYSRRDVMALLGGKPGYLERYDSLVPEILRALRRNGFDADDALERAAAQVIGWRYNEFFEALNHGRRAEMEEAAEGLVRLHGKLKNLDASMARKLENAGRFYDDTTQRQVAEAFAIAERKVLRGLDQRSDQEAGSPQSEGRPGR